MNKIPFEHPRSFLENIVVNGPVGIMMTDYDFIIKYMNKIALDIHGIKKEDYQRGNIKLTDYIIDASAVVDLKESLISEKETNITITYDVLYGDSEKTIRAKINLARDEYYYPIGGLFFICEDVTEVKKLGEKAHEAEKLETLQKVVTTYNHEMNNILAVIIGRIELVLRKAKPSDRNIKDFKDIHNSAIKLSEIVRKIGEIKRIKEKDYLDDIKMLDINSR